MAKKFKRGSEGRETEKNDNQENLVLSKMPNRKASVPELVQGFWKRNLLAYISNLLNS